MVESVEIWPYSKAQSKMLLNLNLVIGLKITIEVGMCTHPPSGLLLCN